LSIKRMAGVTLVELIIAIVIVGTALAGLVAAYNRANAASADPLIAQQILAIAETMMEEVMLKPYGGQQTVKPANRADYTEVGHYNGYATTGIVDVGGNPIAGLARYNVQVSVDPAALTNVAATDAVRIRVLVTQASGQNLQLTGWRTKP